ncbi:MAG: IPTL-CTERM sorting domain-containing protein [Betaproteobacteria bacterium]|nr:IPTL-CTERM sorting domain-containing protein [Betaproteobacteria bacterium]
MLLILRTLAATLLLLFSLHTQAQQFARAYGGGNVDNAYSVLQTADGGYVLAGFTESFGAGSRDFWVLRLDASGSIVWQRAIGGSLIDTGLELVQTTDGGFAVAGITSSFGAGSSEAWVVKLDAGGNLLWNRVIGNADADDFWGLAATSDGGVIAAGSTRPGGGTYDGWLVKLSSAGAVTWQRRYTGAGGDAFSQVRQTADGGYVAVGYTDSFGAAYDLWVVKTDPSGAITWQRNYGGAGDDFAYDVRQTSDGGYIVAGTTDSFGYGANDGWVLKLDASGNVTWQRSYGDAAPANADGFYGVRQTSEGGYIVSGWTNIGSTGSDDAWLMKLDGSGNITWQRAFGTSSFDYSTMVTQTADGGYALSGTTAGFGAGSNDAWLIKCDSGGNLGTCAMARAATATTTVTAGTSAASTATDPATVYANSEAAATLTATAATVFTICAAAAAAVASAVPAISNLGLALLMVLLGLLAVHRLRRADQ